VARKPSSPADAADLLPSRFFRLLVNVSTVYERAFSGKTGEESDYNPKRKLKPSDAPLKAIGVDQFMHRVNAGSGWALPSKFLDERKSQLHPQRPNKFELWADAGNPNFKTLQPGEELRVLTKGDSIFVDKISRLNQKTVMFKNREQNEVAQGWAGTVLQFAEEESDDDQPFHQPEGVDDDEWSD